MTNAAKPIEKVRAIFIGTVIQGAKKYARFIPEATLDRITPVSPGRWTARFADAARAASTIFSLPRGGYVVGGVYEGAGAVDEEGRLEAFTSSPSFQGRPDHPLLTLWEAAEIDLQDGLKTAEMEKKLRAQPSLTRDIASLRALYQSIPPYHRHNLEAAIMRMVRA